MILIRIFLIGTIIYLIFRSFAKFSEESVSETGNSVQENKSKKAAKGVPKELGEYVDFEEVDKN
jgi:hypothetical protein